METQDSCVASDSLCWYVAAAAAAAAALHISSEHLHLNAKYSLPQPADRTRLQTFYYLPQID